MDAKTKKAWKYIKELNYYSKKWGEPLAKLIDQLIGNMTVDNQIKERDEFIEGVKKLQKKRWLVGNYKCMEPPEHIIIDEDNGDEIEEVIKMNVFFRIWYWIPFKWGSGNKKADISSKNIKETKGSDSLQIITNVATIIGAITGVIQFVRSLIH